MTRRERLENKLQRRLDWGHKAESRSAAAFDQAHQIADGIPFGQPILVGHHSEAHARRDADRIMSNMDKGVQEHLLAKHHQAKASGLADQLERSIYSDDTNAIEALEARIAEREAEAQGMVDCNKAWRKSKGDVPTFARLMGFTLEGAQRIADNIEHACSWEKQPYPAYELSNLRNRINTDKKRLEEIKTRQARAERAEAAGGVLVEDLPMGYVRLTFDEKPPRAVLDALHAAAFHYGAGSWLGLRANLPEVVTA